MQKPVTPIVVRRHVVVPEQVVDRAAHVLGSLTHVEGHHQLAGLVGLGRGLSVEQIGRQGDEPLGGEPVDDVLDVRHEAPPLLDHDQSRTATRFGHGAVAGTGVAVARKFDVFTHGREPYRRTCASVDPTRAQYVPPSLE